MKDLHVNKSSPSLTLSLSPPLPFPLPPFLPFSSIRGQEGGGEPETRKLVHQGSRGSPTGGGSRRARKVNQGRQVEVAAAS